MSYSFQTETVEKDQVQDAILDAVRGQSLASAESGQASFVGDHVEAVMAAVGPLVQAAGRPEDQVKVRVVGHANVDHAPQEGWADEQIQVTIEVVPAAGPVETFPTPEEAEAQEADET